MNYGLDEIPAHPIVLQKTGPAWLLEAGKLVKASSN